MERNHKIHQHEKFSDIRIQCIQHSHINTTISQTNSQENARHVANVRQFQWTGFRDRWALCMRKIFCAYFGREQRVSITLYHQFFSLDYRQRGPGDKSLFMIRLLKNVQYSCWKVAITKKISILKLQIRSYRI